MDKTLPGLSARPEFQRDGITVTAPVSVRGDLERESRGIRFEAVLEAGLRLECVRCLEPFEKTVSAPFVLRFVPKHDERKTDAAHPPQHPEVQLHREDCETWTAPEGRVDLEEVAAEQILLAIPAKPLCREECLGLCPSCGGNKNESPCSCPASSGDRLEPWKQSLLSHGRT